MTSRLQLFLTAEDADLGATAVLDAPAPTPDPAPASDTEREAFLALADQMSTGLTDLETAITACEQAQSVLSAAHSSVRFFRTERDARHRIMEGYFTSVADLGARLAAIRSERTGSTVTVATQETVDAAFPGFPKPGRSGWHDRQPDELPSWRARPSLREIAACLWDAYPLERAEALGLRHAAQEFLSPFGLRYTTPVWKGGSIILTCGRMKDHYARSGDPRWDSASVASLKSAMGALSTLLMPDDTQRANAVLRNTAALPTHYQRIESGLHVSMAEGIAIKCYQSAAKLAIAGPVWAELVALMQSVGVVPGARD